MPAPWGVNLSRLAPFAVCLAFGAALPAAARGQDKGKIDDVEKSAENAENHESGHHGHDHGDDDGGGGFFWLIRLLFHSHGHGGVAPDGAPPAPEPPGQGYLDYPYAGPADRESFVLRNVTEGRTFSALTADYFLDDQSSLRAGRIALEVAYGIGYLSAEYSFYREPRPDGTDYLHLARVGLDGLGPLGDVGYVKVGLGLQGLVLDNGRGAGGPELELGVQSFPGRPFGLGATARLAPLTWEGGPLFGTGFVDLMANGSVFIGRVELQGGYRWTRVGLGEPFRGPTVGMRVWF